MGNSGPTGRRGRAAFAGLAADAADLHLRRARRLLRPRAAPAAIAPDSIPPNCTGDVPGGYDIYGPRVPAVVGIAVLQAGAVTDVVHDHTSVLATIEAKWNLPALTYRDADAATSWTSSTLNGPGPGPAGDRSYRRLRPDPRRPRARCRDDDAPANRGSRAPTPARDAAAAPSSSAGRARRGCASPAAAPAQAGLTPPRVRHVFVIMLENEGYSSTFGDPSADPYLASTLPAQGALLRPTTRPATRATTTTSRSCPASRPTPRTRPTASSSTTSSARTLPDGVGAGMGCVYPARWPTSARSCPPTAPGGRPTRRTWATTPTARRPSAGTRRSAGRRNPESRGRRRLRHAPRPVRVLPLGDRRTSLLRRACRRARLARRRHARERPARREGPGERSRRPRGRPGFSFITPNLCDDGHDYPCTNQPSGASALADIDSFLETWVPTITRSPAFQKNGLLESPSTSPMGRSPTPPPAAKSSRDQAHRCPASPARGAAGSGAVLLSPSSSPGTVSATPYNHYSSLATWESLLDCPAWPTPRACPALFGPDVFTATG